MFLIQLIHQNKQGSYEAKECRINGCHMVFDSKGIIKQTCDVKQNPLICFNLLFECR